VPAVTFIPSESFAFANCLASLSVGNDFVCLTEGDREETGPCCFGVSTETNQRLMKTVCLAMMAAVGVLEDVEQCHKRSQAAVIQIKMLNQRSRASLRRPQCISFRDGSNTRST
jgi:hypothetical protein